ncbi:MAG: hypothetical protein JSW66_14055 [Phycisphaerales bacterium]|nr:MAG: hypothetical protein JSW66_14055 [Phycisphaerales bacterium]
MGPDQIEDEQVKDTGDGTPVCLRCFRPVDPIAHYCPHCGEATGQFTHYLPFESIPWLTRVWGQVWRQIWSRDVSLSGRAFRLFMVVWNVPVMLIGLLFRPRKEKRTDNNAEPNKAEAPKL